MAFKPFGRTTEFLFPPSINDWLPENHLARFIVEVVDSLDLTALTSAYQGRGSAAYHPAMLLSLLVYGYATGVFSSRKIERATYDSVAFRFIAADSHPDHDSIATFRRRFLPELGALFTQVLEIAHEMKLLKVGSISVDGTKIHANASRHQALSHGHIGKLQTQLNAEVAELFALAEQADNATLPDGMCLPEEIQRREVRLTVLEAAQKEIKRRAHERFEREQIDYQAKLDARAAREKATGKKPGGKLPQAPTAEPLDSDQVNLTDAESRIMPVSGGGFEQAYNAQAAVDTATMLVIAAHVTQAPNDKQQIVPILAELASLPEVLGRVTELQADTGYCSTANIQHCEAAGVEPFLAVSRESHHPHWRERFTDPAPLAEDAAPLQKMAHKLKTVAGHARYALRKQTIEPVFGIIKSVMGFRQFSLRGVAKVSGEWNLVCLAWNLKRMAVLRQKIMKMG